MIGGFDFYTLLSIAGALLGIIGALWGYAMRPYNSRLKELEENDEKREQRLHDLEIKTTQHDVKLDTLTNSINQLITKMDVFLQQLINRN